LKILSLNDRWFPDHIGGLERVGRDVVVALAARGHEVVALAPKVVDKPDLENVKGVSLRRVLLQTDVVPRTYSDPLLYARILRDAEYRRFDVVLAQNPSNTTAALVALGIPVVYVFHASGLREARQRRSRGTSFVNQLRSLSVEPGLRYLESRAARQADRIVVLSDFSRQLLVEDHPVAADRVRIAPGGADVYFWKPSSARSELRADLGVESDAQVLFTARRLVARTGVDLLLDAFARLLAERPGIRLVIAGDGEDRSQLEARSIQLGLTDAVQFLGRIPDQDLLRWYQAADLFVLPTIAYEGFGMATVEALATGLPVAATPVGATPEILRPLDPSWIAADAQPASLADAISNVLDDLSSGVREQCRTYAVERYSWARASETWEQILEEAVARRPSG
jgi:glycosyltransferase involved in cell wall biosynthesis